MCLLNCEENGYIPYNNKLRISHAVHLEMRTLMHLFPFNETCTNFRLLKQEACSFLFIPIGLSLVFV